MRIFVLAFDGVFDTGLSVVLDTFATANELAQANKTTGANLQVSVVGVRRKVKTAHGLTVPTVNVKDPGKPDVVVVPALGVKEPAALSTILKRQDVRDAMSVLGDWSEQKTLIAAACTSTFVLAESSLLAGREATTTWWLAPMFKKRYPDVRLEESQMLVKSAGFVTAGAALAHIDAALWIVRRSSPVLASLCARYLLVEPRSSQAPFIMPDHLAHTDPVVNRFERWARGHLAEGFSLAAAARASGTSERTLARRIAAVLDKSPLAYFQDLRIERALHLMQTSGDSVEQIAAQVGYENGVTLRALLRRKLGNGVREFRKRP